ncbi:MAG: hypothetical protein H0T58_03560 [Gemmatimonadales bacterium]|nr:hypothetical protein [Gemmatimonadales bacterium]
MVTDHTLLDPIVRVRQEVLYAAKVALAGESDQLSQFTVPRYGHCAFTVDELQLAFGRLVPVTAGPGAGDRRSDGRAPGLAVGRVCPFGKAGGEMMPGLRGQLPKDRSVASENRARPSSA